MSDMTKLWIEGARLRTLPAAVAPVIIGAACAHQLGGLNIVRSLLALAVALLLQIGVNFSNDYSDGIRGTDDYRIGPPRLTGSGAVPPKVVLYAALACFALAGVAGLVLIALAGTWWMMAVGALAIAAAWFYTGGRNPYGYMGVGLSELLVFVFFGLVATVGTTYIQTLTAPWWVWVLASGAGCVAVALLMVNNIRDRVTDIEAGKRTLVVRLGDRPSRWIYAVAVVFPALGMHIVFTSPAPNLALGWGTLTAVVAVLMWGAALASRLLRATKREEYLELLRDTGFLSLWYAAVVAWVLA